jgi:hypothetical protein
MTRNHDHDVRRLAHAENGMQCLTEDRVTAERHEGLRLGMAEPRAAARGDDDHGGR